MKLLFCPACSDVFKLTYDLRCCSCGKVRGRYTDDTFAEVNGEGYSLAIGNGSLLAALASANPERIERRPKDAEVICWVRNHEGPDNPHTKINRNL